MWLRNSIAGLLLIGLVSTVTTTRGDEPPMQSTAAEGRPSEERIREALRDHTKIEVDSQPLDAVVQFLGDTHDLQIRLDRCALDEGGVGHDTEINLQLRDVALSSALRLMLRPLNLTYVITDEVLLITTLEAAEAMQAVRVYPVADLAVGEGNKRFQPLIETLTQTVEPNGWDESGGTSTVTLFGPNLVVRNTEENHERIEQLLTELRVASQTERGMISSQDIPAESDDEQGSADESMVVEIYRVGAGGDEFVKALEQMIAPETWLNAGGEGTANMLPLVTLSNGPSPRYVGGLVVRQRPAVHRQIAEFIHKLEDKMVAVGGASGGGMFSRDEPAEDAKAKSQESAN